MLVVVARIRTLEAAWAEDESPQASMARVAMHAEKRDNVSNLIMVSSFPAVVAVHNQIYSGT